MRTFVAVELSEEIRKQLVVVGEELGRLRLDGRPTRIEGIHLTLKFLGEIDEAQIEGIGASLEACRGAVVPFRVDIEGVGVFPHLARPRVVWVGVRPSDSLKQLQSRVETGLEALGFAREGREFSPHLTMMRLKSPRNLEGLARYVRDAPRMHLGRMEVSEFHLFQSLLRPQGAEYRKLLTFQLKAAKDLPDI